MADNMGGISDAWFVFVTSLASMRQEGSKARIELKAGEWINLHPGKYGSVIKVEPQKTDSGTLYSVSGTIQIPRQYMTDTLWQDCVRMNRLPTLIKYKNLNGDIFVIGSERFPLRCTFETLHPSSPGGFSGYKITIFGKQLTPQLQLKD